MRKNLGTWVVPAASFALALMLAILAGQIKAVHGRAAQAQSGASLKITDFSVAIPNGLQQIQVTSTAKAVGVTTVNCSFGFIFFDKTGQRLSVKTPAGQFIDTWVHNFNGVDASSGTVPENFTDNIVTVSANAQHKPVPFNGVQASYNINSVLPAGLADVASAGTGTTPGPVVPGQNNGLKVTITNLVSAYVPHVDNITYGATAVGNPNATPGFVGNFQFTVTFQTKQGNQVGAQAFYVFLSSNMAGNWAGGVAAASPQTFAKARVDLLLTATDSAVPPNSGAGNKTIP